MDFGFVTRNLKSGLIYQGSILDIDYCLDDGQALSWYNKKPADVHFEDATFDVYGKKYKLKMPVVRAGAYTIQDITPDFRDYLTKNGKLRLLSDIIMGVWSRVLMDFDCVNLIDSGGNNRICFQEKTIKTSAKATAETNEQKGLKIAKKEFLDGYVRVSPYEYKAGKSKTSIPLGFDYNIEGNKVKGNYTIGLRKAMFANATSKMERNKFMMDWQYDVQYRMGHITYVVGPRRAGKTFLVTYLSNREMIGEKFSMQNQMRPINVIYIGLTAAKNMKVVNYLKRMCKEMGFADGTMFHYDSAKMIFSFRSGKDTLAEVSFVSAESKDPGVGDYADLIIIDEAAKMPKDIFEGIQPIVTNEGARLICISTLYEKSRKGRFYEKLIEAENETNQNIEALIDEYWEKAKDLDLTNKKDILAYVDLVEEFKSKNYKVGLRYTIDDIEIRSESKKDNAKKETQSNPDRYMAELYSRFPDEGKVFQYEPTLIGKDKVYMAAYKYVVVGYDPALTFDNPAVIVGGFDEAKNKIVALEEYELAKRGKYEEQAEQIKDIMKNAKKFLLEPTKPHIFLVVDGSQKASAEALEIKGLTINLRVAYTSGSEINQSKNIHNEQKVPKDMLVEITKNLFDNNRILVNMDLKGLCKEFDYFQIIQRESGRYKYEGVGSKDDKVNALMLCCYYFYNTLGIKYQVMKPTEKPEAAMTKEELKKYHQMKKAEEELKKKQIELQEIKGQYYRKFVY